MKKKGEDRGAGRLGSSVFRGERDNQDTARRGSGDWGRLIPGAERWVLQVAEHLF